MSLAVDDVGDLDLALPELEPRVHRQSPFARRITETTKSRR